MRRARFIGGTVDATWSPVSGADAAEEDDVATKTFKSERAAKTAYTKAENAYDAKRNEGFGARDSYRQTLREHGSIDSAVYESLTATEERCAKEAEGLFEEMREIYDAATAQGFYVKSWHFGHNPTRDLIAANMD